jgi:hypothetical protein
MVLDPYNERDIAAEFFGVDHKLASEGLGQTVAKIVSDRYLNQAIGACCTDNGYLFVSKPVRTLIARYAPADRPTMNAIPQEQRRQFLDELAKVTGRALPPEEPIRVDATLANQNPKLLVNGNTPIVAEAALANQDATLIANGYELRSSARPRLPKAGLRGRARSRLLPLNVRIALTRLAPGYALGGSWASTLTSFPPSTCRRSSSSRSNAWALRCSNASAQRGRCSVIGTRRP